MKNQFMSDIICSSLEETVKQLRGLRALPENKGVRFNVYTSQENPIVYTISKNIYEDKLVSGYTLPVLGKHIEPIIFITQMLISFFGPGVQFLSSEHTEDFLILASVFDGFAKRKSFSDAMIKLEDLCVLAESKMPKNFNIDSYKSSLRERLMFDFILDKNAEISASMNRK